MAENFYRNLDDALNDVARRSFYEDCTVTPVVRIDGTGGPIGYVVEDESGAHMSDEWEWNYDAGILHPESVDEVSRLMESYEIYDSAAHIRYNMPESVEVLENGTHAVTFAYAVVDLEYGSPDYVDEGDNSVGWILAANHWEH